MSVKSVHAFESQSIQSIKSKDDSNRIADVATPILNAPAGAALSYDLSKKMNGLEAMFQGCYQESIVGTGVSFTDYLSPNEGNVVKIQEHLDQIDEPGLLVSVGTERSFFTLALGGEKFTGLTVLDINWKVKAYVDFNTLLLRLANDRIEYVAFSTLHEDETIEQKIEEIRSRITLSDIPPNMKKYYLDNLEAYAPIYFETDKDWRICSAYKGVQYHLDNQLFLNLQNHAKSGNIIAKVNPIGDLHFLKNMRVAAVDVSNVGCYSMIDLQGIPSDHVRVIWTRVGTDACYFSYTHRSMSPNQREELDQFLNDLQPLCRQLGKYGTTALIERIRLLLFRADRTFFDDTSHEPPAYSEQTLNHLKAFRKLVTEWPPTLESLYE